MQVNVFQGGTLFTVIGWSDPHGAGLTEMFVEPLWHRLVLSNVLTQMFVGHKDWE